MPRYPMVKLEQARLEAIRKQQEAATDALVSKLPTRKGKRQSSNKVREQTEIMIEENDFERANPRQLVMYYVILHEKLYGVAPAEIMDSTPLARRTLQGAESAARRLLVTEFRERPVDMASFIFWVFKREHFRRNKAKESGRPPSEYRIGWKLMFSSRTLYTDYMVAQKARASR
jgi:hypothetical protein